MQRCHVKNSFRPGFALSVAVVLAGSLGCDHPDTETKRLVARCLQEPAVVVELYYSHVTVVASAHDKAPVEEIVSEAKRRRSDDLRSLSESHRLLVEQRMLEVAEWINEHTTVTVRDTMGLFAGIGGGETEITLPQSEVLNGKIKGLCISVFDCW